MTDAPSYIDLSIDGPVATLLLNRPEKLNAWSWESARQIAAHADALRFRDDVRVVVVRAEGRAFCAGVDLGMPEDRITGCSPAEKTRNYYERFRWVHERFREVPAEFDGFMTTLMAADPRKFQAVTAECLAWLDRNERARLQWRLESSFAAFEARY